MQHFAGRVAVVTGGASGIGKALARAFAAEGMKVVLADVEKQALDASVAELSKGGRDIELLSRDLDDWRITFVDTGMHSNIGTRLTKVRQHLEGEEMFLASYADALTDLPLNDHIADFEKRDVVASFVAVPTGGSFHALQSAEEGIVTSFGPLTDSAQLMINAGYFVLRQDIFDYIQPGEELVEAPFQRLIQKRLLAVNRYRGFWQQMDTFKDKITYDRMEAQGKCPWMLWRKNGC